MTVKIYHSNISSPVKKQGVFGVHNLRVNVKVAM